MVALILVLLLSIENFAAVVGDNDGAAFITKAEFDSLKNNFQSQIDQYNTSIDSKIDGTIASYLAGINLEKENKISESVSNYNQMRFYHDFKFYGRQYIRTPTSNKSVSDLDWWPLQRPESSYNSRGGRITFSFINKWSRGNYAMQILAGAAAQLTNVENADNTNGSLGDRDIVPHEVFRLEKITDTNQWKVSYLTNSSYPAEYWRITFKPKVDEIDMPENTNIFQDDATGTHPNKCIISLNDDPSKVISLNISGYRARWTGDTNASAYAWTINRAARDVLEGYYQVSGNSGLSSETIMSSSFVGAGYATVTKNLSAVVPYDFNISNNMIAYGSFPYSDEEFEGLKYDEYGNVDFTDVNKYNKANMTVQALSFVLAPSTNWGWYEEYVPTATNLHQASGYFYLPIPPNYKLHDYGNGNFKTKSGTYLKYSDGLQLFEGLMDNGNVEIVFKLLGFDAKTEVANTTGKAKLYLANSTLNTNTTINYLFGSVNDGSTDIYIDKEINGLSLDYNKTYKVTIPNYSVKDKTNGDKYYIRLVPDDNDTYCSIEDKSLNMKLISS